MPVLVAGSIATDHLMHFPGRFTDQFMADQLHNVSLSFLVDDLVIRRGGVAPNICYGMAQLGGTPVLIGAVGEDFEDYRAWLERNGVNCRHVLVSEYHHTARFICTTDDDLCQIGSFYTGAMSEARNIELAPASRATGADLLFSNEYERGLLESKSGLSGDEVLARVNVRITTLGKRGVEITGRDVETIVVPVAKERAKADPTGVGDAFRAGLLTARDWGLSWERSAQVGNTLACYVLETLGTQEYEIKPGDFADRLGESYGDDCADEVLPFLS